MSAALPTPQDCCTTCTDPVETNVPGPQGPTGGNGTNGTDGLNAFAVVDGGAALVPAYGASGDVPLVFPPGSLWIGQGQVLYVQSYGYFQVVGIPDNATVTLLNLGDVATSAYLTNVDGNGIITFAGGTRVQPGGFQGPPGNNGAGGAPVASTYITQTQDVGLPNSQYVGALATGLLKVANTTGVLSSVPVGVADGNIAKVDDAAGLTAGETVFATATGVESKTAALARTALGLASMALQSASAVAITGGAMNGTLGATTPAAATVTTLSASGAATLSGKVFTPPSALQTVAAANLITAGAAKIRLKGSGGPVVMTSTPTIAAGTADGQLLIVQGTDDTNTVALQDNASLAGSQLKLAATSRVLGKGDNMVLSWDSSDALWLELSFNNVL